MTTFLLTEEGYQQFLDESSGYCLACGTVAYGVEPDARKYTCEVCNARKVYGIEEVLLMGLLAIVDDDGSDG